MTTPNRRSLLAPSPLLAAATALAKQASVSTAQAPPGGGGLTCSRA